MPCRRSSNPQSTQQLWDAIKIIRYQRQIPDLERITRFMIRLYKVKKEEVAEQLELCVNDGLITLTNKIGARGSKLGVEQRGYFLPKGTYEKDNHDWYCFVCHASGDVITCTSCWRVYHRDCLSGDDNEVDDEHAFVCSVCKEFDADTEGAEPKLKPKVLNRLLGYTCQLLAGFCPVSLLTREVPSSSTYVASGAEEGSELLETSKGWVTDADDEWRSEYLLHHPIDLLTIQGKAERVGYRHANELKADVETLVHNMVVYHGEDHEITTSARKMLADCAYDLNEIRQCPDCYRVSNELPGKHWFCEPCQPPHELVYAKQGTYPYWPAKVIRVDGDTYDVRFFGGPHQRALIAKGFIRPITVDPATLQIKRTASWIKADEELKLHQEKLKQKTPTNVYDFNSSDDEKPQPVIAEKRKSTTAEPKKRVKKARQETGSSEPPTLDDMSPGDKPSSSVSKAGSSEEDMVSSSCQYSQGVRSAPTKAKLDKLRRENELAIKRAVDAACRELREQLEESHANEIQSLKEEHATELSEVKLKQWCYNCEREAIYHCCWNTAYCSTKCQQDHWITQHKPHCRRKRQ